MRREDRQTDRTADLYHTSFRNPWLSSPALLLIKPLEGGMGGREEREE